MVILFALFLCLNNVCASDADISYDGLPLLGDGEPLKNPFVLTKAQCQRVGSALQLRVRQLKLRCEQRVSVLPAVSYDVNYVWPRSYEETLETPLLIRSIYDLRDWLWASQESYEAIHRVATKLYYGSTFEVDKQRAYEAFCYCVQQDPTDYTSLFYCGRICEDQGGSKNTVLAENFYYLAVKAYENQSEVYNDIAWVYARLGRLYSLKRDNGEAQESARQCFECCIDYCAEQDAYIQADFGQHVSPDIEFLRSYIISYLGLNGVTEATISHVEGRVLEYLNHLYAHSTDPQNKSPLKYYEIAKATSANTYGFQHLSGSYIQLVKGAADGGHVSAQKCYQQIMTQLSRRLNGF